MIYYIVTPMNNSLQFVESCKTIIPALNRLKSVKQSITNARIVSKTLYESLIN